MGSFHRLLDRQLKRYFGSEENISPKWNKFLDAVNAAYIASDEDRAMVEHSLELSSQEMLQTNAQMRGMFQAFPDVYFHMDASGKILQFASGSTDSLFGASENLLGKRLSDVLPKEVSAKVESALQEVFRTNSLVLVEYSLIERNEEKIFEARFVPYAGNQVSTIIRDVTLQKQEENALKLFRTLMDNSSDAIEVLDPRSLRYLDVNKKACEELGYSRNELLSLSVFDIDPNVTASSYAEAEDIKQKGAQTLESQHKRKDGSMFPVEVNVTFVSLDRDYLVSVVRNITERKRVEEKLAESEERFRTLFEGMMDGVYRSTHEGKFVDVNHSMIQMFGYANREEMLQVDIKKELYFAEEDRESHFLDTGTEKVEIFRMRRKDGAEIWVEDHGRYVHDEHGKVIFHEGVLRDVTERKLIEERIRNNEEQLQLFIEHTPASIAMFDTEMKYLVASRQWHVNYNLREENIIGKSHYEVFPEIPDRWKEIHKRCLAGATEKCEEDQFPRLDGTVDWVRWEIIPWHKSNGEIGGIILFTELITERKKLEEQLRQSQKMESIGVLAGGIAHDFNNLLGIIGGYASLLERKKNDPEKFSQNIEAITAAVTRGASLVKQMLTFARKANIVLESVNVQALLEEISAMCQQTFPKTITFSVHSEPNLPSILGDANQLHQALLNICVNARDAMPNGGKLSLRSQLGKGTVVRDKFPEALEELYIWLSIGDTGTGIDEQTKQRMFEPFFTTKDKGKGTGLGLSAVYGIVKSHNGYIDVESETGKGTTFHFYFPARALAMEISEMKTNQDAIRGGTETIMIVEDEEMLGEVLKNVLEDNGYSILWAKDGLEAVEMYRIHQQKISAVVTDMGLPKLDGAAAFIKMHFINPKIKVILASGYLEPEIKSELFKAGAKEFIQKPYKHDEILRKVRDVIDNDK